ncbi:uncharacterized protein LOC122153640 isoform X2 [Tyto alba]|uniref:uncharacterized protein LOC122153640 isoform X1 n=1 Tax=Tyto alba TaxID=56313 RepID=UPI001C665375|nr:uncharacterized protein LOC122153640 isoform X1 [Tyto alba]XP_042650348.1 uncharacterized protein LOC122153640 isoform X2 [Tyto alba]
MAPPGTPFTPQPNLTCGQSQPLLTQNPNYSQALRTRAPERFHSQEATFSSGGCTCHGFPEAKPLFSGPRRGNPSLLPPRRFRAVGALPGSAAGLSLSRVQGLASRRASSFPWADMLQGRGRVRNLQCPVGGFRGIWRVAAEEKVLTCIRVSAKVTLWPLTPRAAEKGTARGPGCPQTHAKSPGSTKRDLGGPAATSCASREPCWLPRSPLCPARPSAPRASAAEVLGEGRRPGGPQSVQGGGSLGEVALGNPVPPDTARQGLFPSATGPVCVQRGSEHTGPSARPASAPAPPSPQRHLMSLSLS